MSGIAYYPPTTYFPNINFNNDFYAIPNNNQGISLAYANTHFLFSTGVATSTAVTTYFSGSVGIGTISGTAGTLNALTLQENGTALTSKYLQLSGGTMTGTLTGTTINATTLQQGGIPLNTIISNNLSSYSTTTQMNLAILSNVSLYLPLSGGTLTGILTGTTINATTLQQGGIPLNTIISNNLSSYLTATQTSNQFLLLSGGTVTGNVGIGTTINSSYSLTVNTLNVVTSISLSGTRFNTIYQYLINNVVFGGTTGGSGSSAVASGTLTLTMPTNYSGNFSIAGNAGIGTSSSSTNTLFVNGTSYLNSNVGIGTTPSSTIALTVNGTSYMNGNVGIGTTPSSTNALTVNGALNIISNPTNPGNTTSASFWNQAGVGPTISGLNLSVQTNGTTEAMRINSSGNTYFNGNLTVLNGVGIGTNVFSSTNQLEIPYNASYTTQLRCEGGSGIVALSIGGNGNINVDAPGVVGGRFTILNGGNVGIGSSSPQQTLDVAGVIASSLYIYAGGNNTNGGLRIGGFDYGNTIYQGSTTINGNPANIGFTLRDNNSFNFQTFSSAGVYTTLATININNVTLNEPLITPQFYTASINNIISKVISITPTSGSGGPYGNGYWLIDIQNYVNQSGFSYLFLNVSVPSIPLAWCGRIVIANGSMSTYVDYGVNVQISLGTLSGRYQISVSGPGGTGGGYTYLYYKIFG